MVHVLLEQTPSAKIFCFCFCFKTQFFPKSESNLQFVINIIGSVRLGIKFSHNSIVLFGTTDFLMPICTSLIIQLLHLISEITITNIYFAEIITNLFVLFVLHDFSILFKNWYLFVYSLFYHLVNLSIFDSLFR